MEQLLEVKLTATMFASDWNHLNERFTATENFLRAVRERRAIEQAGEYDREAAALRKAAEETATLLAQKRKPRDKLQLLFLQRRVHCLTMRRLVSENNAQYAAEESHFLYTRQLAQFQDRASEVAVRVSLEAMQLQPQQQNEPVLRAFMSLVEDARYTPVFAAIDAMQDAAERRRALLQLMALVERDGAGADLTRVITAERVGPVLDRNCVDVRLTTLYKQLVKAHETESRQDIVDLKLRIDLLQSYL